MGKHTDAKRPTIISREVRAELGTTGRPISNTTLWRWVKRGLIPAPHHMNTRAVWYLDEIQAAKERLLQPPRAA
jgi:predicted DNA-binding transcriptional regulator AlpA